ncbi:MAG: YcaO-like family protein, partial [Anaerolineales bacterium]|nr:YcaO-like family protein [Anaerolineales bacterium]
LEDTTEKENGLSYTTVAGHSFPLIQNNLRWLQRNLRSHTGGKGRTLAQAKMSAMGEAIERYASVYRGDEPIVKGSLNSLGDEALDIRSNLHFSPSQYADRWRWNNNLVNPIHLVPNPFDPDLRIDWAPAWSLSANRQRLLPAAYCYFGHPDINNHFFCSSDSNGVAAGSTREEAILQGFMELIERDAVGIWWFNELQRPAVAVDSFDLPYLNALRAHYGELNREFWVLDITNDTGITTFAAVSRRVDEGPEDILVGFGSGLTAEAALMGAVTELNQFLPAVSKLNARGERAYEWPTPDAAQWWREVTVAAKPFLLPDSSAPARRPDQFANLATTDVRDDIHVCVAQMSKLGLETIVQDLTRPDIELNVCRVVVPGLRHFWRRLGAGRLYDVPVQLGWLPAAKSEAELNEWSLFF